MRLVSLLPVVRKSANTTWREAWFVDKSERKHHWSDSRLLSVDVFPQLRVILRLVRTKGGLSCLDVFDVILDYSIYGHRNLNYRARG